MTPAREGHVTDLLGDYQAGLLSASRRESVAAHLAQCAACREELVALERTASLLDDTLLRRPDRDLWPEVAARLSVRRARWWTWTPARSWAVAVCLVVLLVGIAVLGHQGAPGAHLAVAVDDEGPLYARWHAEAGLTTSLGDTYALALAASTVSPADKEAESP